MRKMIRNISKTEDVLNTSWSLTHSYQYRTYLFYRRQTIREFFNKKKTNPVESIAIFSKSYAGNFIDVD